MGPYMKGVFAVLGLAFVTYVGCLIAEGATAVPTLVYTADGVATYHAQGHPGAVSVDGDGVTVAGHAERGAGDKVTGVFAARLTGIDAGIGLRTKHLREKFLHTDKWPDAKLVLDPWQYSTVKTQFTGQLTMMGVTKPVSGTASVSPQGTLHAEFDIDITQHGMPVPEFMGVSIDKVVAVTVEALVQ